MERRRMTRGYWSGLLAVAACTAACPVVPEAAAAETATERPVLMIGLVPQDNAVRMVKKWQPFAEYLAARLGRPVEITLKPDYGRVARDLLEGNLDLALLGSLAYVQAAAKGAIVPLARRVIFGSDHYRSIIVVHRDGPITALDGLEGRRFAFTDKNSTTGYALPVLALKDAGLAAPERFFSEVIFTGNHDSALLAVYTGSADGAALSTTRLDPRNSKLKRLRVIWRSEEIPLGPFVARQELGAAMTRRLREAILRIGDTADTRPLLAQLGVDGFVSADDRDYASVRVKLQLLGESAAEE